MPEQPSFPSNAERGAFLIAVGTVMKKHNTSEEEACTSRHKDQLRVLMVFNGVEAGRARYLVDGVIAAQEAEG